MELNSQTTAGRGRIYKKGMKKDLLLKRTPDGLYFTFYFEGGGEVPQDLMGVWDPSSAESAKQKYLSARG